MCWSELINDETNRMILVKQETLLITSHELNGSPFSSSKLLLRREDVDQKWKQFSQHFSFHLSLYTILSQIIVIICVAEYQFFLSFVVDSKMDTMSMIVKNWAQNNFREWLNGDAQTRRAWKRLKWSERDPFMRAICVKFYRKAFVDEILPCTRNQWHKTRWSLRNSLPAATLFFFGILLIHYSFLSMRQSGLVSCNFFPNEVTCT